MSLNLASTNETEDSGAIFAKDNKKEKPSEIKENYIESKKEEIGISAYKSNNDQVEIMSPFRKRKGTLQKLKRPDSDSDEGGQSSSKKPDHDFKDLQPVFDKIVLNLAQKHDEFDKLKSCSLAELTEMYKSEKLQNLSKEWQ